MDIGKVFGELRDWIRFVEADMAPGKEIELRYEHTPTPIRVLKIQNHRSTLLFLWGLDDAGQTRGVMLTTPPLQFQVRMIDTEGGSGRSASPRTRVEGS